MKIYEIIVCNNLDDTSYSLLIASKDPLDKTFIDALELKIGEYYYIEKVRIAKLENNGRTEKEYDEIEDIKNKYFK